MAKKGMLVIAVNTGACDPVLEDLRAGGMHVVEATSPERIAEVARLPGIDWTSILVYRANGVGIELLRRARAEGITAYAVVASTHEELVRHSIAELYRDYTELGVITEVEIGDGERGPGFRRLWKVLKDTARLTEHEACRCTRLDALIAEVVEATRTMRSRHTTSIYEKASAPT